MTSPILISNRDLKMCQGQTKQRPVSIPCSPTLAVAQRPTASAKAAGMCWCNSGAWINAPTRPLPSFGLVNLRTAFPELALSALIQDSLLNQAHTHHCSPADSLSALPSCPRLHPHTPRDLQNCGSSQETERLHKKRPFFGEGPDER